MLMVGKNFIVKDSKEDGPVKTNRHYISFYLILASSSISAFLNISVLLGFFELNTPERCLSIHIPFVSPVTLEYSVGFGQKCSCGHSAWKGPLENREQNTSLGSSGLGQSP